MLRFVKRRNPAQRPPARPEGSNLLDGATRDWRKRLEAINAAHAADKCKPSGAPPTDANAAVNDGC